MWALVTTLITTLCCWTSFQFYWGIIHSWSGETWSQFTPWQQIFFFCCKGFHCWMVLVTNFNNRGKGLKKNHLEMWRGSSISMAGACRFFKNSVVLKFFILAHVQLFYQIIGKSNPPKLTHVNFHHPIFLSQDYTPSCKVNRVKIEIFTLTVMKSFLNRSFFFFFERSFPIFVKKHLKWSKLLMKEQLVSKLKNKQKMKINPTLMKLFNKEKWCNTFCLF